MIEFLLIFMIDDKIVNQTQRFKDLNRCLYFAERLTEHLGKPLTSIPDPFEKYESFGHHNNAKLKSFLDKFNFD